MNRSAILTVSVNLSHSSQNSTNFGMSKKKALGWGYADEEMGLCQQEQNGYLKAHRDYRRQKRGAAFCSIRILYD